VLSATTAVVSFFPMRLLRRLEKESLLHFSLLVGTHFVDVVEGTY